MGEVVNLRRARKARDRAAGERAAAENRARHGRTKARRIDDAADSAKAARTLAQHRLEDD